MQSEPLGNIKKLLEGKGHFVVKIPKSKYSLFCKCISSTWSIDLLNYETDTVERVKDSIEKDKLGAFIDNLLNIKSEKNSNQNE